MITGGARSGKSSFALKEAERLPGNRAFIATMEPGDDELRQRIARHQAERGPGWETFEEPLSVPRLFAQLQGYSVVLVDCLTLWLANLMQAGIDPEKKTDELLAAAAKAASPVFLVSNEVGMGIVPENALARQFRDQAGFMNRRVAATADEVYLVVAGIAVRIK